MSKPVRKTKEQKIRDLLIRCKNRNVNTVNKRNGKRLAESTLRHRCTNANAEKYRGVKFYGEEPEMSPLKKRMKTPSPSPSPRRYPSPSPKKYPIPSPKRYPSPSSRRSPSPTPKTPVVRAFVIPPRQHDQPKRTSLDLSNTYNNRNLYGLDYTYDTDFLKLDTNVINVYPEEQLPNKIIIRKMGKSPHKLNIPAVVTPEDINQDQIPENLQVLSEAIKQRKGPEFGLFNKKNLIA